MSTKNLAADLVRGNRQKAAAQEVTKYNFRVLMREGLRKLGQ
jgi:hypothetical protein